MLKEENKTSNDKKESKIIILDVIPIKMNEKYPSSHEMWTFRNEAVKNGVDRQTVIDYMYEEMKEKFSDSDIIIVLENRKVIKILGEIKNERS